MNDLEKPILKGVCKAHKEYDCVSDGWWLYHAPESFIQSHLASYIARKGKFCIFPECSPKRWKNSLDEGNDVKPRGRPFSKHNKKRFDLVIWRKKVERPGAIVEIKRAVHVAPLLADAHKVLDYKKEACRYGISTAYILVYSEAKRNTERAPLHSGKTKLKEKFGSWSKSLEEKCGNKAKVQYVGREAHEPQGQDKDNTWSWGVALYRLDYPVRKKRKRVVSRSKPARKVA